MAHLSTANFLAEAYASLKQKIIDMGPTLEDDVPRPPIKRLTLKNSLPSVQLSESDMEANDAILKKINPSSSPSPQLKV